jgi:hypothetical protein
MFDHLEDHGLPLVQLKEQRRDLVVALRGRTGPLSKQQISEIAAIQQAIAAVEAVMVDMDAEFETVLKEQKRRGWRLLAGIRAMPATAERNPPALECCPEKQ